jgi:hypothetical protein
VILGLWFGISSYTQNLTSTKENPSFGELGFLNNRGLRRDFKKFTE